MKDTILRYLRMPGTWAGLATTIGGVVSSRYGSPVGDAVTQILLFVGGALLAAPV